MSNKISARIIADSENIETGDRITTFVCVFPRIILAELNTHRAFSRNSASSRAIPFKRMVEMVQQDPFIPIAWQKDHKGMQGTEYITDEKDASFMEYSWRLARIQAIKSAELMNGRGCTKQLCNRILEPFMWHTAIITATEFENFFKLRCPRYKYTYSQGVRDINYCEEIIHFNSKKDWLRFKNSLSTEAECYKNHPTPTNDIEWLKINEGQGEIHIMALAEAMWDTLNESSPKRLLSGQWHIPFGDNIETRRVFTDILKKDIDHSDSSKYSKEADEAKAKIATARCARVSYLNFEGKDDYEADIKLHDILLSSGHMSPFEHCARTMDESRRSGNFKGFLQYRKMVEV